MTANCPPKAVASTEPSHTAHALGLKSSSAPSSDADVLVRVENVSKKFCRSFKRSLWYGLRDIAHELNPLSHRSRDNVNRPAIPAYSSMLRDEEFWAVDDVSFQLRRGECLGLIGPNGAGKSTLLKILNGLVRPDIGQVEMRGRVGALIELGAGFNPILTGRENIYINASVLGLTKKQTDGLVDEIIDFAGIGDCIDTPVQNYSSGMKVKLGFAVACQMKPDVLIIDEVLAVGDTGFRLKCFAKIYEISQSAAIILVSHSMPQIGRICTRVMVMDKGKSVCNTTDIHQGAEHYFSKFAVEQPSFQTTGVSLGSITVKGDTTDATPVPVIRYGDDLVIHAQLDLPVDVHQIEALVGVTDMEGKAVIQAYSATQSPPLVILQPKNDLRIIIPNIPLTTGRYMVNLQLFKSRNDGCMHGKPIANFRAAAAFAVKATDVPVRCPVQLPSDWRLSRAQR